jgi:hypothetical protein
MSVFSVARITQPSSVLNPHTDYPLQDSRSQVADTSQIDKTHMSAKPPPTPTSVHFSPPMQTPGCRQNTSPNFSTFGPSLGYKVPSTLVFEHWQLLLQQYPNSHFPNILAGTSACVNVVIFYGGEHTILLSSRAGYSDNPRYNMS